MKILKLFVVGIILFLIFEGSNSVYAADLSITYKSGGGDPTPLPPDPPPPPPPD